MKPLTAAAALLLLAPPTPDGLALGYEEGLVLVKTVETRMEVELVDLAMELELDGETRTPEAPDVELVLTTSQTVVLTDEVLAAEDGRPTALRRTFDAVEGTEAVAVDGPDGAQEDSRDGSSDLEGESVVFEWDADAEEWEARADDDSDVDEDLLAGLEADAELAVFVDPDAEEGDAWDVGPEAYTALRLFGGELTLLLEGEEEVPETRALFHENLAGGFEAEWTDTVDEDGRRVAVVELTGELDSDYAPEPPGDLPDGIEIEQEFEVEIELEGVLRWDLEAGRLVDLELAGEIRILDTMRQSGSNDEHEFSSTRTQEMAGEIELRAAFEAE